MAETSGSTLLLLAISAFTTVCSLWLAVMELILRHSGYPARIGIAAAIALISAATFVTRLLPAPGRRERWLWIGACPLIIIGGQAFLRNEQSPHFEGFTLIMSSALIAQGLLMLFTAAFQERAADSEASAEGRRRS